MRIVLNVIKRGYYKMNELKTQEYIDELDAHIRKVKQDKAYYGILKETNIDLLGVKKWYPTF